MSDISKPPVDVDGWCGCGRCETSGDPVKFGMCHCRQCDLPAPIADRTRPEHGYVKGQPVWFAKGHGRTVPLGKKEDGPNPSGLCECGCGNDTPIATRNHKKLGFVKGQPIRFIHGHSNLSKGLLEKHYTITDLGYMTSCWVWNGARLPSGYGVSGGGRKGYLAGRSSSLAHRAMYEQEIGPIPEGMVIDHICHNPKTCQDGNACQHRACVNPTHLEAKTRTGNSRRSANAKLDETKVAEIRALLATGKLKRREIAAIYRVSVAAITFIATGRTWKQE